jgi:hypothetical protein
MDLVPLFQRLAGFRRIFLIHLKELMTVMGNFLGDFRKVLSVHYMW